MKSDAATVDDYLAEVPEDRRQALATLRDLINQVAPDAHEQMKYGHPHWDLEGPLFSLASQKRHMSLYVDDDPLMATEGEALGTLAGVDVGKCCIRFRSLDRLPLDRVEALLAAAAAARR